jgi:ABC-2 type transport system permease protein
MSGFTGTGRMLALTVRRDRILAAGWIGFLVLLVTGTAAQYDGLFPTAQERADFVAEVGDNAALRAFTGVLHGDDLGNLLMWKVGDIAFSLLGLATLMTVIRHTRAEEEAGRTELLAAGVLGRFAPATSALIFGCTASLLAGLVSASGAASIGAGGIGAVAFGLAMAAPGCVMAGVAAVTAQFAERSRTAIGLAGMVFGASYVLRFLADGADIGWMLWLSPNGWSHLVQPYGANRFVVLLVPFVVTAGLATATLWLVSRRDLGAGVIPPRPGPAAGAPGLRSPLALAWRLHRGQLLGWTAGFAVFGAATAAVAAGMEDIADRSGSEIQEFFRRYAASPDATVADTFLWLIVVSMGMVATLFPLLTVRRLHQEETSGRADLTLATAVTRRSWGMSHVTVAALGTVVILIAAGFAAGLVHGLMIGDVSGQLPRLLEATLVQVPAVWTTGAVLVLFVGAAPRLVTVMVWVVFGLVNLFGESLGPILGLDNTVADRAVPFHYVPKVLTGGELTLGPLAILILLALLLSATGLIALQRRDLA